MAYFNHAYNKMFVATKDTQSSNPGSQAEVTDGILTEVGVHVSNIKDTKDPYQLGVGVVGMFDAKTNLSVTSTEIAVDCCPFYLAAASLKLNDKQGPFHGGYQESNKSKVINPKYIRKTWKVNANKAVAAQVLVGGMAGNGATAVTIAGGGTGYTTATGVAVSGGSGVGMTVDFTDDGGGVVNSVTIVNPGYGYIAGDVVTIQAGNSDATVTIDTVDESCNKEFLCGETYYLRVDVKGTSALRFANHNLYRTLDAFGGCCDTPASPTAITPDIIYKEFANQIVNDPYISEFILPFLIVDGVTYVYDADTATAWGLDPVINLIENAPAAASYAGLVLQSAFVEKQFENCTFQPSDYYQVEPLQLFVSEVDLNGDPCTFQGICVEKTCPGLQAQGGGEQKLRALITSESYLQNFMSSDLRIREITQGTSTYEAISRLESYSSFFILHSVPRFNNPSGVFDNDQYLLEIVGTDGTTAHLESEFTAIDAAGCTTCSLPEDYTAGTCDTIVPQGVSVPK